MKCTKCGIEKTTKGYDPEWISPRWEDTDWFHLCNRCSKRWYRIWNPKERELFFEFIQPERLSPETPEGDAIVRTTCINEDVEISRND